MGPAAGRCVGLPWGAAESGVPRGAGSAMRVQSGANGAAPLRPPQPLCR